MAHGLTPLRKKKINNLGDGLRNLTVEVSLRMYHTHFSELRNTVWPQAHGKGTKLEGDNSKSRAGAQLHLDNAAHCAAGAR